ncbi:Pestheic acid cluster transcriptional regulator 3 [Pseudocercospora fuligena]|uniref:Pestheic acid cluster transcriptional regulator 3 n=1 Tax=Pseudocercospora fuligena TaxID=685502 RepID=A0A8H6RIS5_9PEZI|nr:Pestheic acid cluster transcriptional regulator 3 [Pseudocercospora fuligena]
MKGSGGCWSCRARRKRCDGRQPMCGICSALHITCYYGSERPQWMDGGSKQEEMAQILKREVKMNAHRRRIHAAGDRNSYRGQDLVGNDTAHIDQALQKSITSADVPDVGLINAEGSHPPTIRSDIGGKCPILGHSTTNTMPLAQSDAILLMFYLDNLFPFMFPFYQPDPLATGGKAWILEMIMSSPMLRQIALCQSSYFFNLAQDNAHDDSGWQKFLERTRDAFATLKQALSVINSSSITEHLHGAVRILTGIVQVQRFGQLRL